MPIILLKKGPEELEKLIKLAGEGGIADNSVEERAGGAREADKIAGGEAAHDNTAGESEAIRDKAAEGDGAVLNGAGGARKIFIWKQKKLLIKLVENESTKRLMKL